MLSALLAFGLDPGLAALASLPKPLDVVRLYHPSIRLPARWHPRGNALQEMAHAMNNPNDIPGLGGQVHAMTRQAELIRDFVAQHADKLTPGQVALVLEAMTDTLDMAWFTVHAVSARAETLHRVWVRDGLSGPLLARLATLDSGAVNLTYGGEVLMGARHLLGHAARDFNAADRTITGQTRGMWYAPIAERVTDLLRSRPSSGRH